MSPDGPVSAELEQSLECVELMGACRDLYTLLHLLVSRGLKLTIYLLHAQVIELSFGILNRFSSSPVQSA